MTPFLAVRLIILGNHYLSFHFCFLKQKEIIFFLVHCLEKPKTAHTVLVRERSFPLWLPLASMLHGHTLSCFFPLGAAWRRCSKFFTRLESSLISVDKILYWIFLDPLRNVGSKMINIFPNANKFFKTRNSQQEAKNCKKKSLNYPNISVLCCKLQNFWTFSWPNAFWQWYMSCNFSLLRLNLANKTTLVRVEIENLQNFITHLLSKKSWAWQKIITLP